MSNKNENATADNATTAIVDGQSQIQNHNLILPEKRLVFNDKIISPLVTIDGKSLLEADLPPIKFVIDKILPQGLFILAGAPKVGKSWLSLDFCQAVASGGQIWDSTAEKGSVLYLALEDSLSRLQARLKKYTSEGIPDLHFGTRALKIHNGLIVQVTDFINNHPDATLVIIDTMQHIRNNANDKNAYVSDYKDMEILRQITNHFDVALLLVTHTRKMDDPDPLNTISGSTGLVGAVDGVMILEKEKRTANGGRLTIANRDTEGYVFLLEFDNDTCRWNFIEGETAEEHEDSLFETIIEMLSYKNKWSGTSTELCKCLSELEPEQSFNPAVVSKKLKSNQNVLKNKYKVDFAYEVRNNVKLITLSM